MATVEILKLGKIYRGVVSGGEGARAPLASEIQKICRKFQNFISSAHVRDDVMGFECKRSSEKY